MDGKKVVSMRAFQHDGYWHITIRVSDGSDTEETADAGYFRLNTVIPDIVTPIDQAQVVAMTIVKGLHKQGAIMDYRDPDQLRLF